MTSINIKNNKRCEGIINFIWLPWVEISCNRTIPENQKDSEFPEQKKKHGIIPLRRVRCYAVQPPAILNMSKNHLVPISGYSISWNIITLEKRAMHYDPVWMHSWIFLTCNKLILGHSFLWGFSSTNLINLGLWKQQYIKYQKEHGLKGWGWCFLMTFFLLLISWCSNTQPAGHSSCCLCQCLRQWITDRETVKNWSNEC